MKQPLEVRRSDEPAPPPRERGGGMAARGGVNKRDGFGERKIFSKRGRRATSMGSVTPKTKVQI